MSSNLRTLAIAGAVALASGVSVASTAAAQSHTGFYAGAFIQNDFRFSLNSSSVPPNPAGLDGAIGAFAGYNYDVGSGFVVGGEAEVQYDWLTSLVPAGSAVTGIANVRAGYSVDAFGHDLLLYGKAGAGVMTGAGLVYNYGVGGDLAYGDNMFFRGEIVAVHSNGFLASKVNSNPSRNPRVDIKLGMGYSF